MKLPQNLTLGYTPPRGTLGIFVFAPSDGCPATPNLLSLDTSLAIATRVLHLEVSGLRRCTPIRPVPCCCTSVFDLWSWLCGSSKQPSAFLVNHWKLCELGEPLVPGLVVSCVGTHPRLHLVVLSAMRPAFDFAGNRVPRTEPTCLFHTWRPH
jgi:hypothetical protein